MFISIITKTFGTQSIDSNIYNSHKTAPKSTLYRAVEYCMYGNDDSTPLFEKRMKVNLLIEDIIANCKSKNIRVIDSNYILNYINQNR